MFENIRKLTKLLTAQQRREYIVLQIFFLLTACIQVAGIASIAPFIALVSNPDLIHTNPISSQIYELSHAESNLQFLTYFALVVMAVIFFSNLISGIATWITFYFSLNLGNELQHSLYKNYLLKDFVFFSKNNSSKIMGTLAAEIPRFVYMVLQPLLNLTGQLFVIVLIVGGLIYVDPLLAFMASVIVLGSYLLVFRLIKNKLSEHGKTITIMADAKFKHLNESFGGIKEIKLLGTERDFEKTYVNINEIGLKSMAFTGLSGDIPKFFIETIAFCALLGLAIFLLYTYGESGNVISLLSLYGMAGYRLLPAAQTVFKSVSQIRGNWESVASFYDDVLEGRQRTIERVTAPLEIPPNSTLTLDAVSYSYPDTQKPALSNINLTIKPNTITSLVGPSGSGKSTLADLILGMLTPTHGALRIAKIAITPENTKAWQRHLGYVAQSIFISDDSIKANITFGSGDDQVDEKKLREAARKANIAEFVEGLTDNYDFVVGERGAMLSGGQRQRLGIARALYHDADILVFDEATSALDPLTEREIMNTIMELRASKTIIMITHRLSTIKLSDQIVLLGHGKIQDVGSYDEMLERHSDFQSQVSAEAEMMSQDSASAPLPVNTAV